MSAEENTGQVPGGLPLPPAREGSTVKLSFKEEQAEEFAKLKAAIAEKGSTATAKAPDAAKLASARLKGNPNYKRMFENATAGKKIAELYESNATAKRKAKANAKRAATVTSTTAAKNNSAPLKTAKKSKSKVKNTVEANLRGSNVPNTGAMNAKVDYIVSIASGISVQVNELMRFAKTLKSGRAPNTTTNTTTNTTAKKPRTSKKKKEKQAPAANSVLGLPPLPVAQLPSPEENANAQENVGSQALQENSGQGNLSTQAPLEENSEQGVFEAPAGVNVLSPVTETNEGFNSSSSENSNNENSNAYTPPQ